MGHSVALLRQLSSTLGNRLQHAHRGIEHCGGGRLRRERCHLALHHPQEQVSLCQLEEVWVGTAARRSVRQQGLQRTGECASAAVRELR